MIVENSGTQTAVVGTEHTLASPTTAKTRVLVVDASALTAGEVLELRFKGAVLFSGAVQEDIVGSFTGVLTSPGTVSPPIPMPQGGSITLKQTSGTGRAFPWSIITLD